MEVIKTCPDWRDKESVVTTEKTKSNLEIERKFFLQGVHPERLAALLCVVIQQGYIFSDDAGEVRLRSSRSGTETVFTLTVKGSGDLSRSEVEQEILAELFAVLWPRCCGSFEKLRFHHPSGVIIDVFTGDKLRGLVIAEMEFSSTEEAASFEFPADLAESWIDVTAHKGFKGKKLALDGFPFFTHDCRNDWNKLQSLLTCA